MKKTHFKTYIILAIFLSIIGISIAYASLSQQLQIKTNTTVQSSQTSWNISYQPLDCSVFEGYVKLGTMTVNGTTITLSGFALQAPESLALCYFNIINNGELDAKISTINGPTATFTGSGDTKDTDEKLAREYFSPPSNFARWTDGSWTTVKTGDKVSAGQRKKVVLSIGNNNHNLMSTLPTNPVSFSITYTINFSQA